MADTATTAPISFAPARFKEADTLLVVGDGSQFLKTAQ